MGFNATMNVKEGTRLFNNVRRWPLRFVLCTYLSVYLFALYIGSTKLVVYNYLNIVV